MEEISAYQALSERFALPEYAQPAYTLPSVEVIGSGKRAKRNYRWLMHVVCSPKVTNLVVH
jgi:hypothetical protein